jgi:WD40 repeat protein
MGCEEYHRSFPPLSLTKYDKPVNSLAIDPTGTTLATAGQEDRGAGAPSLLFWDLKSGQSKTGYENGKEATALYYSKDGKRLLSVVFWLQTLAVWDAETGKRIFQLDGKGTQWVGHTAFAPDGTMVATSDVKDTIRLWNVDAGQERCALAGHTATVRSLAFSPDGKLLASASGDQTVRVWDVAAQKLLATFPDHEKPVNAIAFSPDGALLASGGEDGNVILWDVSTLKQRSMIVANYETVITIAFQPDGKQLAVVGGRAEAVADKGEEGAITFFDTATGKALQVLTRIGQNPIDQRPFCCVSFSPDGKLLATGSLSATQPITVWEQDDHGIWKKKW